MIGKYTFSLNGDQYLGAFESRSEAVCEAIKAAHRAAQSPATVYVGRMVLGDPKSGGHARAVLANMGARAREEFGDAGSHYLAGLSKPQIESLDEAIELVITGWLQRNELMPTFFKVEAIGEYLVPAEMSVSHSGNSVNGEVQEIGSGDYEM
ncbi:MAG: hypothetical protein M3O30_04295 [Planctomycetota bacterium]|nr:hypothetical protein [Planctomycetota bacterium]